MVLKLILCLTFIMMVTAKAAKQEPLNTTADAINKGKTCVPDTLNGGTKCDYKIGKDLSFTMTGMGTYKTEAIVGRSIGESGDYSLRFVKDFPCVVITAGLKTTNRAKKELSSVDNMNFLFQEKQAYISPSNGNVYKNEVDCKKETVDLKKIEKTEKPSVFDE